MSPGGGAPGDVGGAVGGGGSLDGGNLGGGGSGGSGGGSLPGGPLGGSGGGSGEAQPSTQQTNDGIGAPCVVSFRVNVKTTRNGTVEACTTTVARINLNDSVINDGGMAPPDLPPTGPSVTLTFLFTAEEDNPFNVTETKTTQCVEGLWQTVDTFLIRYPGKDLDCSGFYQLTAQASWYKNGKNLSSNAFKGPPLPERDENYVVPIDLTMELGTTIPPTTSVDTNTNSTVLSY